MSLLMIRLDSACWRIIRMPNVEFERWQVQSSSKAGQVQLHVGKASQL